MVRFEPVLKAAIADALNQLYGHVVTSDEIILAETRKEFEGDTTLVVFPFIKSSKKSPEQTGTEIGEFLLAHTKIVSDFQVVKGFLNLSVTDSFWKDFFTSASGNPFDFQKLNTQGNPKHLMVEYSSPNTNKPLHLGHIRNNLLGYSVAEILKAVGHRVEKVNLVNDRGIHICKSMLAWQKYSNGETPESSGMKGDHLVGKYYVEYERHYREEVKKLLNENLSLEDAEKGAPLAKEVQEMLRRWEAGDQETMDLWKTMNGWVYKGFEETYKSLGVDFNKTYYESQTYLYGKKIVEDGLNKGLFFKKEDGSIWVDLSDAGLDQKVLLRNDGTSVYITQDLGTAQLRFDEYKDLEQLIYVVGNEQDYHFKVLKEIFRKLNRPWAEGLIHLSYGMVDLPSGKMKSREGTVVDGDDLIKEITEEAELATKALGKLDNYYSEDAKKLYSTIGMGALKYFILKVDPRKRMMFNPTESIDLNGNTGPFIQYTYARIRSVIRKGEQAGFKAGELGQGDFKMSKDEKNVIRLLYRYPEVIQEAAGTFSPATIANYTYELARSFNHFYHDHVIVNESEMDVTYFRLNLSIFTSVLIKECLRLLGIESPERM